MPIRRPKKENNSILRDSKTGLTVYHELERQEQIFYNHHHMDCCRRDGREQDRKRATQEQSRMDTKVHLSESVRKRILDIEPDNLRL